MRVTIAAAVPGADVWLAIVEDDLTSDVTRGENAGKKLAHTAVARGLVPAGRADAKGRFDVEVPVPPGPGVRRVFAFAQERGVGRVLGVSAPLRLLGAP